MESKLQQMFLMREGLCLLAKASSISNCQGKVFVTLHESMQKHTCNA
jgi:hypothetical protein